MIGAIRSIQPIRSIGRKPSADDRIFTMVLALAGIWTLFALLSDSFLTPRNLSNLLVQTSVTAILAVGMLLVIVSGHIDLSVGSIVGLTGGIAAILQLWAGWPTAPAVVVTLLAGVAIGFLQGWWVAYRAVPAFIVTLGGMMAFRGALIGITDGQTVAPLRRDFLAIGQSYLPEAVGWTLAAVCSATAALFVWTSRRASIKNGFEPNPAVVDLGRSALYAALFFGIAAVTNAYKGVPVPFLGVAVLAGMIALLAGKSVFGRHVYAVGGNVEAARLSGIPVRRRVLAVFVLSGAAAALAGILQTARLNAATISSGTMYELDAIAACVIGGTSLMGGRGTVRGVLVGALVMASLDNGMSILNVESFWQQIVKGAILVLAVWLDRMRTKEVRA
ncbi:MAG: sugar ABC transporter permease [Candidatus Reconcilbacillus cellulovorans]|uniref:Xylose transport system permease protein XylH n=1 Tax=Candidatus Reconcilbacillus cellulovorans TaxID=1906605 RepID=A0A2A6E415_9BACL|nr:MAG: sugar ABC transporter permease [Candidatus Reconcilbacillus cellulovorans]